MVGILLSVCACNVIAAQEPDVAKDVATKQVADIKTEKKQTDVTETNNKTQPTLFTVSSEKLFDVISARAKQLAANEYIPPQD
ncbi:hypothetical protein, partial [Staphylococcus aureus]|uniref:hypothetical protein n=1 Tax=Staphylococcus aureus TaxID=1280 RepID=UPI00301B83C3